MQNEKARLEKLLRLYGLDPNRVAHCSESFQALRPRYHNESHCYSTALTFEDLARQAGLGRAETRHGIIAALYHDAQHQMASADDVNLESAVHWFESGSFTDEDIDDELVKRLILSTHNKNTDHFSKTSELLHDADLLQTVKGTLGENLLWQARLAEELVMAVSWESSIRFVTASLKSKESIEFLRKRLSASFPLFRGRS